MINKSCILYFVICLGSFSAYCTKTNHDSGNTPLPDSNKKYTVEWDQASLKQVAIPNLYLTEENYSYARMIKSKDASLVCVYEHNGNIEMVKSVDEAASWSRPDTIAVTRNNIAIATPEMIELSNGIWIIAYNLRPKPLPDGHYDPGKKFAICIKTSNDKGKTWSQEQLLYEAGYEFKNGCWEPSMLQLPTGEVLLFFSNEGVYLTSDEQNISILRSSDNGATWTTNPEIISYSAGYRDGMPVAIYDNAQSAIFMTIEDNSEGGQFNPSAIKIVPPWNGEFVNAYSANRIHLLQKEITKNTYSGAPYIRQLSDGTMVVSFQSTLNRNTDWERSIMQVAIGESLNDLQLVEPPFKIPVDKGGKWNSLCIINNDSIIALTTTNAFNTYNAIWMIKGKINRNL